MGKTELRIKKKDELANSKYGMSYTALCSERKKIIDQVYLCIQMDEEEKLNPKSKCR